MIEPFDSPELFGSLSREEVLSFLADLWSIRGWTTKKRDDTLVVSHPERHERRRICIYHRRDNEEERVAIQTNEPDTIDCVISTRRDQGQLLADRLNARLLSPDDIREMLLYSIDREEAHRLCRAYFGSDISIEDFVESARSKDHEEKRDNDPTENQSISYDRSTTADSDSPDSTTRSPDWSSLIASILAVLVIGGILIGGTTLTFGFTNGGTSRVEFGQELPSTTGEYPPGTGSEGVTNLTKLVRAHGETLERGGYRLIVVHNRSRGSLITKARWIATRQRIRKTRRSISVRVNGTLPPRSIGASPREIEFTLMATDSSCRRSRIDGDELQLLEKCLNDTEFNNRIIRATGTYLRRYLDTTKSSIQHIDGSRRYRIVARGTPREIAGRVTNYTAVAIVTQQGVVRRLTVEYVRQAFDGPESVRFELRFVRRSHTNRS